MYNYIQYSDINIETIVLKISVISYILTVSNRKSRINNTNQLNILIIRRSQLFSLQKLILARQYYYICCYIKHPAYM